MEFATGAMGSLLGKLGVLLSEEYNLSAPMRREVSFLRHEMVSLEAALVKMAEVPPDQLDEQASSWASEVRELSYAIEDSIDRFMVVPSGSGEGFVKKTAMMLSKLKARHQITNQIQKIKSQIRELADRHARYRIGGAVAYPVATTTVEDPDFLARSDDHRELVGLEESVDELISMLLSDKANNCQPVKIVSIIGHGGMGKTTLAKAVLEKMGIQFDCTAFVSVGRNPQLKRVFIDILLQIDKEKYSGFSSAVDEKMYIDEIQALLKNKRYFIILDDIWDIKSWEIIRCALMDPTFGSIIITTTRIFDVATKAGVVYQLKPLSDAKSIELFYARVFAGKVKIPDDETTEIAQKILQRCRGVPLAITTIANFLSNKPKEEWNEVYTSIGFGAADNTRKILLFSFYDLPFHLRACLLHLSIFPKDYMVRKDTLIWKWAAEGFIRGKSGMGLFETGEQYFNELANRSMIQPVEIPHSGVIIGCYVHDLVVDMICSISKEKNFVTVLNGNEQRTSLKVKVRRLALHREFMGEQYLLANTDMSIVRSFNAISCDTTMIPSLVSFELLRVLAIEDCSFEPEGNAYSLEHIRMLLHLRYLGLRKTPVGKFPEVGNLNFLEVLDLRQTGLRELPKSVSLLSRLKCLRADGGSTRVPDWIGNLTSLEELSLNDVSSCPNFVKQVSKLKELRELKIWIRVLDERSKKSLVKSLGSLQKIQVLHLDGGLWIEDAEWEGYVPPRQLRRLNLRIKSSRLPRWINDSLLPNLSHLSVDVKIVEVEDLAILGSLPELITLELFMPNSVSLDVKSRGVLFPKLRHCYTSGMLRFLQGAAPRLESIHFSVMLSGLNGASFHFGSLGNLPLLEEVRVEIFYSDIHVATEVEERLGHAVDVHINRPILHASKYKSCFDEDAEKEDNSELEEDAEWDEWYAQSPTAKVT